MGSTLRRLALASALTLTACGPVTTPPDATPDAGPDAASNAPPAWEMAPSTLMIGQGQHRTLTVAVRDPEGDAVVHSVTAPPGITLTIEGEGAMTRWALHADYAVTGEQAVTITSTDARGASAQHTLTLTVAPLRWQPRVQWGDGMGPAAREHAALIVDAARNQLLMIGGSGYAPYGMPLGDAWLYDLATSTWRTATLTGDVPAPAGSRRVAQLPDGQTAYLFGGYGERGASNNELYRVTLAPDGAAVRRVEQRNAPPARSLHAFAYDPTSQRFVAFGGAGAGAPLDDTWTMTLEGDTAVWTQVSTAETPSARYGFFAGMDTERGRLIVFSGGQAFMPIDPATDVWAFDLRSDPPAWRQLTTGTEPATPTGRRNGVAVWDPTGPRLVIYGGTADARTTERGLWIFDAHPGAERWTEVTRDAPPPLRSSAFGVYDAARNRVLFGFGNTTTAQYRDLASLGY